MNGVVALKKAKDYVDKTLQGSGAVKGKDGVSPIIIPNADNTDDIYKLDITDINGTVTTPNLKGNRGSDGKTPNIEIGEVTTLQSNQNATVHITGEFPNIKLNFGIPKGEIGSITDSELGNLLQKETIDIDFSEIFN